MPASIYLHLPYCRRKCPYCDFFKRVPKAGERELYTETLLREIGLAAQEYPVFTGPAQTVYFGGGTPSLHPPTELGALLEAVNRVWTIAAGAEITLEANPGTVDFHNLSGWKAVGINRISLGAQSFSPRKLALLYRDHTVDEIGAAVRLARQSGFDNLSLDLIFGLPGETLAEWEHDISRLLELEPEHVSLYNLEFHAGTPFDRWRASGKLVPLSEDVEADFYLRTHELLTQAGFEHYEVSNFARPGFRAVHNSVYWEGKPYLGLGASAHSFDGDRLRFHNAADIHRYFAEVEAGRLPVAERHENTERERVEEWISGSLRRSNGITWNQAVSHLGEPTAQALWQKARELPADLRTLTADKVALTPTGWFRENSVLLFLFDALSTESRISVR